MLAEAKQLAVPTWKMIHLQVELAYFVALIVFAKRKKWGLTTRDLAYQRRSFAPFALVALKSLFGWGRGYNLFIHVLHGTALLFQVER